MYLRATLTAPTQSAPYEGAVLPCHSHSHTQPSSMNSVRAFDREDCSWLFDHNKQHYC